MTFKTNFNKITLLGNDLIKIYFEDKTVEFVPPNVRLYLTDLDFLEFLFLLKQDINVIKKLSNVPIEVTNSYELILTFLKIDYKKEMLLKYFQILFPNLKYHTSRFNCGETVLTAEEYDTLLEFLLVSCGEKDFDSFMKKIEGLTTEEPKISESQKRFKEVQDRLDKIKKGKEKKTKKKSEPESVITYDQIIVAILYEFPSLSIDSIYNMNMITLLNFWGYISKVVDNQIQIVAAGNGNTKKFTYFIN